MPQFQSYIGIDYSGANTPTKSLKGLRIYKKAGDDIEPVEAHPIADLRHDQSWSTSSDDTLMKQDAQQPSKGELNQAKPL